MATTRDAYSSAGWCNAEATFAPAVAKGPGEKQGWESFGFLALAIEFMRLVPSFEEPGRGAPVAADPGANENDFGFDSAAGDLADMNLLGGLGTPNGADLLI